MLHLNLTEYTKAYIVVCLFVCLCSREASQMCLLWAKLQAAQLPRGAQRAMPQLPPLHGAAEQHLHRLVICVSSSSLTSQL